MLKNDFALYNKVGGFIKQVMLQDEEVFVTSPKKRCILVTSYGEISFSYVLLNINDDSTSIYFYIKEEINTGKIDLMMKIYGGQDAGREVSRLNINGKDMENLILEMYLEITSKINFDFDNISNPFAEHIAIDPSVPTGFGTGF